MEEVTLNNPINRPETTSSCVPEPATSGLSSSRPRHNSSSEPESDIENEVEQYVSDATMSKYSTLGDNRKTNLDMTTLETIS